MSDSNNTNQNSAFHFIVWLFIGLIGIIAVLLGSAFIKQDEMHQLRQIFVRAFYGLGISFSSVATFQIVRMLLDRSVNGHWYKTHVEIFAERRKEAGKKYANENRKIHDSFKLMGFSASQAIKELAPSNTLYKAFAEDGAHVQLLIVDPSSLAAVRQAQADSRTLAIGLEGICESFVELLKLNKSYETGTAAKNPKGSLAIRLMAEDPRVTLYIRDETTAIFGHYFAELRGDEYAAMRIEREWNRVVFNQFTRFFDDKWIDAKGCEIMRIMRGSPPFFNVEMFNSKLSECRRKVHALEVPANAAV